MNIAFYSTKPYDRLWFEPMSHQYDIKIHFLESPLKESSIPLASGCEAICIFVNDAVTAGMIDQLCRLGVKAILLRSAGYNHVDLDAARGRIHVLRVPSYSPDAVAEYAMAMLLTVNRYTHRAYTRTRDFNMSINGLMGQTLFGRTAGIIGTGKIGQSMIRICKGFGMNVLAYDPYPNPSLDVTYTDRDALFAQSDIISLHCPLTDDTHYLINQQAISQMKDGVYLINTSRGALIDTAALIEGLADKKFAGVGLDVYEEEDGVFYEDRSNDIINDENLIRLAAFPNVLITSHMGFFTREAMEAIASVTLENAAAFANGRELVNEL
ncbi:2-hydroxyacid dehydrogenase [Ruminococcus gauvreauii]|uniref:2-hydroxyacid dehydrogenase n=1 Tax=Ruminococcus gauvreauii TaxID=438033 RepID=A0ABY5VLZ7_9FIRM|nr:2-hydroxyacid dehydrogenase [Ruminococcus gauvreauii]UWP61216.1 2-hydroxyacid dehydrogenase [Ruminococcus gauvreauii]